MEILLLLLMSLLGARTPVSGQVLVLTEKQQLDLLYLIRAGREVEAIRCVRRWKNASLIDAVTTIGALKWPRSLASF